MVSHWLYLQNIKDILGLWSESESGVHFHPKGNSVRSKAPVDWVKMMCAVQTVGASNNQDETIIAWFLWMDSLLIFSIDPGGPESRFNLSSLQLRLLILSSVPLVLEHVSDVTATKVNQQKSAKSGLPATTLWHHILLTSRREKLHVHRLLPQWSVFNTQKYHHVSVRWSSRTFQEARGYIIVFITIIVIFHFIFAQKKQTNNTFQGADRAPANPQTNHYSYSLLKTQLKSM